MGQWKAQNAGSSSSLIHRKHKEAGTFSGFESGKQVCCPKPINPYNCLMLLRWTKYLMQSPSDMFRIWCSNKNIQWTTKKRASGKGPRQKTSKHVKIRQKVSRLRQPQGKRRQKPIKMCLKHFGDFSAIFARHHFSGPFRAALRCFQHCGMGREGGGLILLGLATQIAAISKSPRLLSSYFPADRLSKCGHLEYSLALAESIGFRIPMVCQDVGKGGGEFKGRSRHDRNRRNRQNRQTVAVASLVCLL